MKLLILPLLTFVFGITSAGPLLGQSPTEELLLYDRLPSFHNADKTHKDGEKHFSDAYIEMSIHLQKMGKDKAVAFLKSPSDSTKVIPLCRMLFTAKPMMEFRRPSIGAPDFFGRTGMNDWKLEPIDIVDGVPFVIVHGYTLGGRAETGRAYLNYAVENCEWSKFEYAKKSTEEKQKALTKLIESKKWKDPLSERVKEFLSVQIK
ncbi:MAG TPA: hypothetical protein VGJ05_05160 [Fimbriiglobus sp.]|jgi:hypothetical protein